MSNSTSNLAKFPYGQGGRNVTVPVDGGAHIYDGTMVAQLTATAMLVPGSTAASGHCVGVADHEQDNTSGADSALRCKIVTDRIFLFANASGGNACSEATPLGAAVYMFDDHTIADNSVGDTLKRAGYFMGLEPDSGGKVRVYITPLDMGAAVDVGEASGASVHGVRGASTADIASLAAFTVAAVDGLTYVAGERILLKNQTATEENGIYVVGTVAAGTAPLTRALDADGADEIVAGMVVAVSEGTAAADTAWKLDTNAPITIDTTGLTFTQVPFGFAAAATIADVDKSAESAGVSPLACRADHKHDISTAAAIDIGNAASAEGAATSLARSNHVHKMHPLEVRYVMTANVANLAAFTVNQDGVTGLEGETVLLANQTTGAECGVYQIGVVGGGTAPLTRVAWLATGAVIRGGYTVHVNEGTLNANTSWFISTSGAITIGTTAHLWFPESVIQSLAIPAGTGTLTITNVPILSATKTMFNFTNASEVTADLTVRYGLNGAATAGTVGTASASMIAEIAAGTVNVDDDSTMIVQIVNR